MKKSFNLLFVLLFISGCGVQNLPALPSAPAPIRVILTPSTSIWSGGLNRCGQLNSMLNVMVDIKSSDPVNLDENSLLITSGETQSEYRQFLLADEEIAIVVNPINPLNNLSSDQLISIYTGFSNTWGSVIPDLLTDFKEAQIRVYHYSGNDDLETVFQNINKNPIVTPLSALSVASPADIVEAVGMNPEAIGFIPKSWLVSSVKQIPLIEKITYPILMVTKNEPDGRLKQLMLCLQEQTKPKTKP